MIVTKNGLILNKIKGSDCNFEKSICYKKSKGECDILFFLEILIKLKLIKHAEILFKGQKKLQRVLIQKF